MYPLPRETILNVGRKSTDIEKVVWTHFVISSFISQLVSSVLTLTLTPTLTLTLTLTRIITISLILPTGWVFCKFLQIYNHLSFNTSDFKHPHNSEHRAVSNISALYGRNPSSDSQITSTFVRLSLEIKTPLPYNFAPATQPYLANGLRSHAKAHDDQIHLGSRLTKSARSDNAPTSQERLHGWRQSLV